MRPIFITGIGTGVGKTLVAAIVAEALQADYWKPVQAGYADGTDSEWVARMIGDGLGLAGYGLGFAGDGLVLPGDGSVLAGDGAVRVYPEVYKLAMAASPHIAAREEGVRISLEQIVSQVPALARGLVIEGAGGLLVPLNEKEFVLDLVRRLDPVVILVSRNYLGSINHSLLTAEVCKAHGLNVAGWIFNDQYLHYEEEIVEWTGIPAIASIPVMSGSVGPDREFVRAQAERIRPMLERAVAV
jgi:dethiobiotin synthetase